MKLVFASNNKHKLDEVCKILPIGVDVLSLQDVGFLQEIEETGSTLEENSAIKARVVWQWLLDNALLDGIDGVFADDTGLEIKSLNGAPGVRTARWASEDAIDINNRQKALLELQGIEDRFARFRTGFLQEIEETGSTLEENSAIKARVVWQWLLDNALLDGIDGVFADDTGLEIKSLNGAPGVRTARWASEDAIDINNRQKALLELQGIEDRFARFRTVVSLILGGKLEQVEGIVNGRIALAEMGDGGFGYDPVFIPEGYDVTFACLSAEEKNTISHRGKAMAELRKILEKL